MADELDPNEIAAKVVIQLAEQGANRFTAAVAQKIRAAKVNLQIGFKAYIKSVISTYGRVKTLYSQDEPVNVEDIYVSVRLATFRNQVTDLSLLSDLSSEKKIIITGNAGTGKSMFLRHALIYTLRNYSHILPVYVELRYLSGDESIMDAAFDQLNRHVRDLDKQMFEEGLAQNRFAIFLDGFDELTLTQRNVALREIQNLCRKNPSAILLITTRPTDAILSLPSFTNYRVLPFEIYQIRSLISKVPHDQEKYDEFIDRLKSGLFQEHGSFLSNPLLAIMMFITFSRISEISTRMHVFYNDAFHVLAQWHDRSKGAFTREFVSQLDISIFRDIFSAFCAYSYFDIRYAFSDSDLQSYIQDACKYYSRQESPASIATDLTESTSLLQRDGISYTFVHRSFQEYFTAVFLKELDDEGLSRGVEALLDRGQTDNVFTMLRDMQRSRFDSVWLIPYLENVLSKFHSDDLDVGRYMEEFPRSFIIQHNGLFFSSADGSPEAAKLMTIRKIASYNKGLSGMADRERALFPSLRLLLIESTEGDEKFANRCRACFGVDWEFRVRTKEQTSFPRGESFDLQGFPMEVLEGMGVAALLRDEVRYLEGWLKGLGRLESRKRLGLKQMLSGTRDIAP